MRSERRMKHVHCANSSSNTKQNNQYFEQRTPQHKRLTNKELGIANQIAAQRGKKHEADSRPAAVALHMERIKVLTSSVLLVY